MNDLVRVSYESESPTVSARDLHEFLSQQKTFEDFYIAVSELRVGSDRNELKALREEVGMFVFRFNSTAITYLCDEITTEMFLPCKNPAEAKTSESEYREIIINRFSELFPGYDFVGKEMGAFPMGRIDILAKCKSTGRAVIFELKKGATSPNKQLIAYASIFKNPILIAITETEFPDEKKLDNIIYLTYKELFESDCVE